MTKKKYEDKLYIDMDFEEALERFSNVDPQEMQANIDKQKKRRSTGTAVKQNPADPQSVVSLRNRRERKHNG